jgi:hypothetical protein
MASAERQPPQTRAGRPTNKTIGGRQFRPLLDGAFQDIELVTKGEVLQFYPSSGTEGRPKNG